MLVYGDHSWMKSPHDLLGRIEQRLSAIRGGSPGGERHAVLVSAWLEAGQLAQGVADGELETRGVDELSPAQDATMQLLLAISKEIVASWRGNFSSQVENALNLLRRLRGRLGQDAVRLKLAEGHAFYAVYPESYVEAAAALAPAPDFQIIGLRTIGAGLGAIVAAALGASNLLTLRPGGDPCARKLALGQAMSARIRSTAEARWAIVDEGPGYSGSSVAATAEMLMESGVSARRIHVFPSHRGPPGPAASPTHSAWWHTVQRHAADFEDWALNHARPGRALTEWVGDLVGEPTAPLDDLGAGAWRANRFASEEQWPPAWPEQERRKYLLRTASGSWLLKFAGLGSEGERKYRRARMLAAAGFSPEMRGLRHGFLVERWIENARPLTQAAPPRAGFLDHLGAYLGFRAAHFGADNWRGASLAELATMAVRNIGLALGPGAARAAESAFFHSAERLERSVHRVEIDAKLQSWEWLIAEGGQILKTDAVDHHAAHDLVGCQDIAWDIAGAIVEYDLKEEEGEALCHQVERGCHRAVNPDLLRLMKLCYCAFQLGRAQLAAETVRDAREQTRLIQAGRTYREALLRSRLLE